MFWHPEVLTVLRVTAEGQTAAHDAIMSDPERRVDETRAAAIEDETGEIARVDKAMLRILPPQLGQKARGQPEGCHCSYQIEKNLLYSECLLRPPKNAGFLPAMTFIRRSSR